MAEMFLDDVYSYLFKNFRNIIKIMCSNIQNEIFRLRSRWTDLPLNIPLSLAQLLVLISAHNSNYLINIYMIVLTNVECRVRIIPNNADRT